MNSIKLLQAITCPKDIAVAETYNAFVLFCWPPNEFRGLVNISQLINLSLGIKNENRGYLTIEFTNIVILQWNYKPATRIDESIYSLLSSSHSHWREPFTKPTRIMILRLDHNFSFPIDISPIFTDSHCRISL